VDGDDPDMASDAAGASDSTLASEPALASDAAWAYDALYSRLKDYDSEASQIVELVRSLKPDAESLLDVGCGTGIHLGHLANHFGVQGVERDPAMARAARRRLGEAQVHQADMRSMDLGVEFDAIISLYSAVGYLLTTDDLDQAVAAMARHLVPGGVLLVEPWFTPERWLEVEEGQVGVNLFHPEHEILVRMVRCWSEGRLSHMEMHFLRGSAGSIRHFVEHHEMRLHTDHDYRNAFDRAGLSVERREPGLVGRGLYIGRKGDREAGPRSRAG
jgi:SAM-dependent methyltransferase